MTAFKATHNLKCRNQTYKVGKTYTSDKLKICKHGLHYCEKMEDTLKYYEPTKDFILLEVKILGKVITHGNKSVTDKLKVVRIISSDEYPDEMKKSLSKYEYDDRNNMISKTDSDGIKYLFEYDDLNNMISQCPNGDVYSYEYDNRNNMISTTHLNGYKHSFEYDDRDNKISMTLPSGSKYSYEYDDKNNKIYESDPYNNKTSYKYDERNNMISKTCPYGYNEYYEHATITEED